MAGSEQNKLDCVIWGGYARGNTGDEWCLAAALEQLRPEFGRSLAVLTSNPEYTQWLFPDVTVVPYVAPRPRRLKRWQKLLRKYGWIHGRSKGEGFLPDWDCLPESAWVRCLTGARTLYLAGGGYLTDLFPMDQILPPIELAARLRLPISSAPIGIGPFQIDGWADRVVSVLRNADLKVRDQFSLDFCRARGLNATLGADPAFAQITRDLPAQPQDAGYKRPRKIGVCIFPQYGQDARLEVSGWWISVLRGLKSQHPDFQIEGFCFHNSLQAEFGEMVRLFPSAGLPARQVRAPILDFREATVALRDYDFIISTRFHAVVAANALKIPNLAVASGEYYLAKMNAAISGYTGRSRLVNPTSESPETLLAVCREILAQPSRD